MTTSLSPAAQAVLDAAEAGLDGYIELLPPTWKSSVAAAIRAIADQVVPLCSTKSDRGMQRMMIRNDFLAIADELEAQ